MTSVPDLPGAPPPQEHLTPAAPRGPFDRFLDALAWLCLLIAGLCLVTIVVTFGWMVWGRYVMNNTPTWVEQLSLLLISYITFFGAAVGVRYGSHLSIDFVRESFPPVLREIARYLSDLLVIVFGALMAIEGYDRFVGNLDRMIPMIDVAEAWRFLPLSIAGVLFMLFAGYDLAMRITHPMQERN